MTDPVDPKIAALQFIVASLNDFTNTLPMSVRASFICNAQAVINVLEPAEKPAEKPAE
jgi:hypothetical protein